MGAIVICTSLLVLFLVAWFRRQIRKERRTFLNVEVDLINSIESNRIDIAFRQAKLKGYRFTDYNLDEVLVPQYHIVLYT